jgi:hypothetical protein
MRQVQFLQNEHELTVIGFGPKPEANVIYKEISYVPPNLLRKIQMASCLLSGAYKIFYWNQLSVNQAKCLLNGEQFDLVLANDIQALPLSLALNCDNPVLFDAHEYSPRQFEDRWFWKFLFQKYYISLCRSYLPQVSSMVTVCRGIAEEYTSNFGVRVGVIHNTPPHQKLYPRRVSGNQIRLIHHGAAIRSRQLEKMIDMMQHLDSRFSLDLMLTNNDHSYLSMLRQKANGDKRIRFIKTVPMPEICKFINKYDVGIYILSPNSFNSMYSLPNKFFEFIQARLCIAIGPSPEMAKLVHEYQCGVVADSFEPEALASCLRDLSCEKVEALKQASDRAARELNFERESLVLSDEIERLLSLKASRK